MDKVSLDQLIFECEDGVGAVTETRVDAICSSEGISRDAFFEAFARRIAHAFVADEISYDLAQSAINNVFSFAAMILPPYAMRVHQAIDEGEYLHKGDLEGTDTIDKYTRPLMVAIVSEDLAAARP